MGTPSSPNDQAYAGFQEPTTAGAEANAFAFGFSQLMGAIWTSALVKVIAVTNVGDLAPVGLLDVMPLVHQVDGDGQATPHGIINDLPYFRLQGGTDAIIIDPKVGDIGLAIFAMRDISAVKASKTENVPGSMRRYDPADGLYVGGFLNAQPTRYIRFGSDGVYILATDKLDERAPVINIVATGSSPSVSVTASGGSVNVTADHVNVISGDVNLGDTGGKKVVLDGDPVSGGVVHASSTKVKAV